MGIFGNQGITYLLRHRIEKAGHELEKSRHDLERAQHETSANTDAATVAVALMKETFVRLGTMEARMDVLGKEVEQGRSELAAERDYVSRLIEHINRGLPPPPPER